jgi:quercetin dioxygenase-like cupin family protein
MKKTPNSKLKMNPSFHQPEVIEKVWGKEVIIHNSNLYCGKILEFKKDYYSSFHYHTEKTETWFVLSGTLSLQYEGNSRTLTPNSIVHLPPYTLHQLFALTDSIILEVSTPHNDNDTIRIKPSGKS